MYSIRKDSISKPKPASMKNLSNREYYKIHSQHHSAKHIRAMKELQKMKVDRDKAHNFVKKYIGK